MRYLKKLYVCPMSDRFDFKISIRSYPSLLERCWIRRFFSNQWIPGYSPLACHGRTLTGPPDSGAQRPGGIACNGYGLGGLDWPEG